MANKKDIINIIYVSLDDINEQYELNIQKDTNTRLFGKDSNIDSLGLVNLIVSIEDSINKSFDTSISIADEKAMSQKYSPFRSIDTLADYIVSLINEDNND